MSPRCGLSHSARCTVVNGTLRSYASLFTYTRSPSRIVGFIEPVGTSFQSANDERTANKTADIINSGRISFFHQRFSFARKRAGGLFFMHLRPFSAIPVQD